MKFLIGAMDWVRHTDGKSAARLCAGVIGRGIAIVELPSKEMRTNEFDTRTLAIKA